jgi:hypothetical protein
MKTDELAAMADSIPQPPPSAADAVRMQWLVMQFMKVLVTGEASNYELPSGHHRCCRYMKGMEPSPPLVCSCGIGSLVLESHAPTCKLRTRQC